MKHIRSMIAAMLVLLLMLPCAAQAAKANTRYTAYTNRSTYVYKKASTGSTKKSVSVNTKVYVVGVDGSFCKVQNSKGSATGYVLTSCLSRSKVSDDPSWRSKVVKMDWFNEGNAAFKKNSYAYMYDIDTGITIRIKRMGGSNHADVEPATASDTAKLRKIAGGKFSWESHAVILRVSGKYIACGINTMPHGDQTIKNNKYDGQFCLHMVNSITHGSGEVNANHQASIERAYEWAHE